MFHRVHGRFQGSARPAPAIASRIAPVAIGVMLLGLPFTACSQKQQDGAAVGVVELSLEVVPLGVACVRVKAAGSGRTVERGYNVAPGLATALGTWTGVPIGAVTFTADAVGVPCSDASATTTPTHIADPVDATVVAGEVLPVRLVMRRNGRVSLSVDFPDEPACAPAGAARSDRGSWTPPRGAEDAAACTGGARTFSLHRRLVRPRLLAHGIHPLLDGLAAERFGSGAASEFSGDDNLYSGVWREGSFGYASWFTTSWSEFTNQWDAFGNGGLRMHDFETYTIGPHRVYAGLFRVASGGHAAWFTADFNDLTTKWTAFGRERLRMHDFETFLFGGSRVFAGIFREGQDGHAAWFTSDFAELTSKWDEFAQVNLRMHDFEVYLENGNPVYAGVFRGGTGGHAALFTDDWPAFTSAWDTNNMQGLRMHDFETYEAGGKRFWAGAFRAGGGGHYGWVGVDWESFVSKWYELDPNNLRLHDFETHPSACEAKCLNQVVMPQEQGKDPTKDLYNYGITSTPTHCTGLPMSCGNPAPGAQVFYRQPVVATADGRFVRFPGILHNDQIFTLPFKDTNLKHNGWLYSPDSWHHAVDYYINGATSFDVVASAPGTVVHVGWDSWSGGTVIVSHAAGGVQDAYRTIYMHLRNGADADCERAWTQTYEPNKTTDWAPHYKEYLEATGCPQDPAQRNPASAQWGSNSEAISGSLLGKSVARGEMLARAGSTGPGGCGCIPKDPANDPVGSAGTGPNTHLHIFFARRDLTNNLWYFIDPYGMYAPSACYPAGMTDALPGACARYPIAWQGGQPSYPP